MTTHHHAFAVHMLNDDGKKKAAAIADAFSSLVESLEANDIATDGRLRALVMTKLEEACFFAKKAMATNLKNQQPPAV